MDATYNPDWRYAKMTRTEIEKHVKAQCKRLTSRKHTIPATSGRKITSQRQNTLKLKKKRKRGNVPCIFIITRSMSTTEHSISTSKKTGKGVVPPYIQLLHK